MLVPPTPFQPPSTYSPNGELTGSESADTSGTSRHDLVAGAELNGHADELVNALCTPGPACQAGIVHSSDTPPPPAPSTLFHTCSVGRGPRELSVVPPTPVTHG
ncbi:MAG: hypothetical protein ABSC00_07120 [Acidimicrobiales bacterium]